MKIPEIREFSMAYEVDKLRTMLRLPITNIVFDDRYEYGKSYLNEDFTLTVIYAKLYINENYIGDIPYMSDKWGPMYDTSKQNELAWDKVYQQFQPIIFDKILQKQPLAAAAEAKENKSLLIKDKDGLVINIAYCNYINNEWEVLVGGLNEVRKILTTTITITPPSKE
jgi:hypothetical protein